jgi:hypothetical protein
VVGAGAGRFARVHRHGLELEVAPVGQRGGLRGRHSVVRGAAVSIGTTQGGVEVGRERKKRAKRGSSSTGCSF